MNNETIRIGSWGVPKDLYDQYLKFRMWADKYSDSSYVDPTRLTPMSDAERGQRWLLCVKKVMELHRQICEAINVSYSEDYNDEFYKLFHRQVDKDVRLKG